MAATRPFTHPFTLADLAWQVAADIEGLKRNGVELPEALIQSLAETAAHTARLKGQQHNQQAGQGGAA